MVDKNLITKIDQNGYEWVKEELGIDFVEGEEVMKEIIIKNHQIQNKLPKDFIFENQKLIIPKNIHYENPIKITIEDDNNESLKKLLYQKIRVSKLF